MFNVNLLKKIFPEPNDGNYNGLSFDSEGLYSITHPKDADIISITIIEILGRTNLNILDMTAGCGGNMISFIKYFLSVTGIELNKERYNILNNNLSKYNNYHAYTIINGDCMEYLTSNYDVYFIDPPWGGPEYKNNETLELYLSDIPLLDIIKKIPQNKLIILKLPFNYNIDLFKYNFNIIKKLIINNIIILFLL